MEHLVSQQTTIALRILVHATDYLYAEYGIKHYHNGCVSFFGREAKSLASAMAIFAACRDRVIEAAEKEVIR